jgi:hypothetical protein
VDIMFGFDEAKYPKLSFVSGRSGLMIYGNKYQLFEVLISYMQVFAYCSPS